jgi:hypothetical protein
MSHITIVINATTPPPSASAAAAAASDDDFRVSVEYTPRDGATPSQIGNEVARIQRRINQIIEATPD